MLKLLIFDLDGTLVDSSVDITNAINHAIEPAGIAPLTTKKVISMVGYGITQLVEGIVPPEFSEEVLKRFLQHYSGHIIDNTRPYPGVTETLSKLGNYKKSVISNKKEALSKEVMDRLGLSGFFDFILGSDSTTERKPSPEPIYKALKQAGVTKNEAIIIGDSDIDIKAGKAAGIKTLAVTYGFRKKEDLTGADHIIDSFEELISVLKEID